MRSSKLRLSFGVFIIVAVAIFTTMMAAGQPSNAGEAVLWSFPSPSNSSDGAYPYAGLIMDSNGNLYGTTEDAGLTDRATVFELIPPSTVGGNWLESILWNFGTIDALYAPNGPVLMDGNGNLYGTTIQGGTYQKGTIFELSPPAASGGNWNLVTLWNFGNGSDGYQPGGKLVMDASGDLYGTTEWGGTYGQGTVLELTAPSAAGGNWSESTLWSFGNGSDGEEPVSGLVADANGNLYGATQLGGGNYNLLNDQFGGTIFELTPPASAGGSWTESILWNFGNGTDGVQPLAAPIMDGSGNLYGTTAHGGNYKCQIISGIPNCGTVFELMPPATSGGNWSESILWDFGNGADGAEPWAGVIFDPHGNLYGTTLLGGTNSGGTAYKLTPPASDGENWNEAVLWNFGSGADGKGPAGSLLVDANANLYGTTTQGGTYTEGTVFEIGDVLAPPTPTPIATPTTSLSASPSSLNLGNVLTTATSKPQKVTLTNTGAVAAQISKVIAIYPFSVGGGMDTCSNSTIAPRKTCVFDVEFTPPTLGEVSGGSIDVPYNGTSPRVELEGIGIPVNLDAPKQLTFPAISAGLIGNPKTIQFSNPTSIAVTCGTPGVGNAVFDSFRLVSDGCSGKVLGLRGKCSIAVVFAPPLQAKGIQNGRAGLGCTYGTTSAGASTALSGKAK